MKQLLIVALLFSQFWFHFQSFEAENVQIILCLSKIQVRLKYFPRIRFFFNQNICDRMKTVKHQYHILLLPLIFHYLIGSLKLLNYRIFMGNFCAYNFHTSLKKNVRVWSPEIIAFLYRTEISFSRAIMSNLIWSVIGHWTISYWPQNNLFTLFL